MRSQLRQIDYHLAQSDLVKIARSVRLSTVVQPMPLRFGWLPPGLVVGPGLTIRGDSPTSCFAAVQAQTADRDANGFGMGGDVVAVQLAVGTTTEAPAGGEPTTVGGRPARFVTGDGATEFEPRVWIYVAVDLGGGRTLTVSSRDSGVSRADLVAIAEHAVVEPQPILSWLGGR